MLYFIKKLDEDKIINKLVNIAIIQENTEALRTVFLI